MNRPETPAGGTQRAPDGRLLSPALSAGRRHARLVWWIAAGTPPLLATALLMLEQHHPPEVANDMDLSAALFNIASLLTLVMGVLIALTTTHRLRAQLRRNSDPLRTLRYEQLRIAREARLRAAWLLIVATLLIVLGLFFIWLPENVLPR